MTPWSSHDPPSPTASTACCCSADSVTGWSARGTVSGARRRLRGAIATSPRASSRRNADRSRPAARGSEPSSARWESVSRSPSRSAAVRAAHSSVRGLPFGGSTSERARAGVEQYSAAIHRARSTSSRGTESGRTALGVTSRSAGTSVLVGQPDDHPVERLPPERDPHHGADVDRRLGERVVERPGQPPGGGQWLDARDHGRKTLSRRGGT